MLFVLTGSSAAGKTAVLAELTARHDDLDLHDFDEIAVPSDADSRWQEMEWSRWGSWQRGDPRWDVAILDTAHVGISETVRRLTGWIADKRRLRLTGKLPLSGEWSAAVTD